VKCHNSYHLSYQGRRVPVCKVTFMRTFGVTRSAVAGLHQRIMNGEIFIRDRRGSALNPNKTPDAIKNLIIAHINRFPRYRNHNSRNRIGEFYLHPDLNVTKMYRLFLVEQGVQICRDLRLAKKLSLYRKLFAESALTIGIPRSDTCKECDKLNIQINSAATAAERQIAEVNLGRHHEKADEAYTLLNADLRRSVDDADCVVLCADLEQVYCRKETHYLDI
jgi:hypothetical protein